MTFCAVFTRISDLLSIDGFLTKRYTEKNNLPL